MSNKISKFEKSLKPIFYTYIYLNPLKPGNYQYKHEDGFIYTFYFEPFYVGKGQGKRLFSHRDVRNLKSKTFKTNIINKIIRHSLQPYIFKIEKNLIEQDAFDLEIKLIELIGRRNLNEGTLANMSAGGEGIYYTSEETRKKIGEPRRGKNHHFYGKKFSKEHIEKLRISHTGIKQPKGMIERRKISNSNFKHTDETKEKLRLLNLGKIIPDDVRQKISNTLTGYKHTDETKEKLRGRIPPNKGKKTSDKTKKRISNSTKRNYNKIHTKESRLKRSIKMRGSNNPFALHCEVIYNDNTKVKYECINDLRRDLNMSQRTFENLVYRFDGIEFLKRRRKFLNIVKIIKIEK